MKRFMILLVAFLAVSGAGIAAAEDTYLPSNQPLIKGTVTEVGEHSVTVDSFNGERMTFTVDSRTVVPTSLQAGTRVKVEFHAMQDGRYHAARVTPFLPTEEEIASIRPMSNGNDDVNVRETTADDAKDADRYESTSRVGTETNRSHADQTSTTRDKNRDRDANLIADEDELPRTAGNGNWLAVIGLIALGAAGSLWLLRRRQRV